MDKVEKAVFCGRHASIILFVAGFILSSFACLAGDKEFPLKDGDTWVMAGDSITAQRLHTNYFEAFCYARFPGWRFSFRNAGVGGDTVPRTLARFSRYIEVWKPSVVSVELGMNDSGAGPDSTDKYISGMNTLIERIRGAGARTVLFAASPVNDGTMTGSLKGRNLTLDKYATALAAYARKEGIIFANQFHAVIDMWGKNKTTEDLIKFSESVKKALREKTIPGREVLVQWMDTWEKSGKGKKGADLGGNPVHPGPAGQMTMCAALLKELNAPGLVSSATVDFSGGVTEEVRCRIMNMQKEKGGISFDRIDQSLPMPIPDSCRPALIIMPSIEDLSVWTLKIKNIKAGNYEVKIDGVVVADVHSSELERGWNMGMLDTGPVADQCRQILSLISEKERLAASSRAKFASLAGDSSEEGQAAREQILKRVLSADQKIRDAAQPQMRHFEITPGD